MKLRDIADLVVSFVVRYMDRLLLLGIRLSISRSVTTK